METRGTSSAPQSQLGEFFSGFNAEDIESKAKKRRRRRKSTIVSPSGQSPSTKNTKFDDGAIASTSANASGFPSSVQSNNQFSDFTDNDDMESLPDLQNFRKSKPRNGPQDRRMKPIIVEGINEADVETLLGSATSKRTNYKQHKDSFTINTFSAADKLLVKSALDKEKVQYHTFAEAEERHAVFVLKGYKFVEPEVLKASLEHEGVLVHHVSYVYKNQQSPVYLVQFKKGEMKLSTLKQQHFSIGRRLISWDKPKKGSNRPSFCARCIRTLVTIAIVKSDASSVLTRTLEESAPAQKLMN